MEHLNTHTTDGAQINLDALYKICPSCFTETKDENGELRKVVDFAKLRALLGDNTNDGAPESYDFTWVGKRAAQREAAAPISKTLRPCPEESVDWENTQNLYIEGDNLEVLKLLQNSYMGKVKMIYIDPPYNTGNDFVYHDDFSVSADEYEDASGNVNEAGERFRKNTDSNGRFHSDWCSMMYARLLVARSLLSNDGAIFISIDDNEAENMKKICNEIFGSSNFVSQFSIASNSSKNNSKWVSITHEYILCFCKNKELLLPNWSVKRNNSIEFIKRANGLLSSELTEEEIHKELLALVKYPRFYEFDHYTYTDSRGPFRASDLTAPGSKSFYDVIHPITKKVCKTGIRGWGFSQEAMNGLLLDNRILFGKDESVMPQLKNYLYENEKTLPKSVLFFDSQSSTKWMKSNNFGFDFPKSVELMQYLISMYPQDNCIVLDFFSGSATTAHATMQLNSEDGGNRKFVMVQLSELTDTDSEAYKAGYKNICEIGKERIRRAGAKIKAENPNVDTGFRVFKCDESNYKDVYLNPSAYQQEKLDLFLDNIKDDRSDLDLLFDCMLRWGVELSLPMTQTKADGCTIHNVNDGDLVACFDGVITDKVIDAIAEMNPLRIVFRDSSFEEASEKMNLYELFKQKCGWSEQEVKNNVRVI